jgi:hypothetical protein
MSSVYRRIRRMSAKTKARALREIQACPPRTCLCGRTHTTALPKCPACMQMGGAGYRV